MGEGPEQAQGGGAPVQQSNFMDAVDRAAARSDQPEHARLQLLARIRLSPACYPGDLTPEQLDQLMAATQLLPPTARGGFQARFLNDNNAWVGAGQIGEFPHRRANLEPICADARMMCFSTALMEMPCKTAISR